MIKLNTKNHEELLHKFESWTEVPMLALENVLSLFKISAASINNMNCIVFEDAAQMAVTITNFQFIDGRALWNYI